MKKMPGNIMMFLAVASLGCSHAKPDPVEEYLVRKVYEKNVSGIEQDSLVSTELPQDWDEIHPAEEGFIMDMAYADTANFTHRQIYDCARCLLRPEAATALRHAAKEALAAGYRIVIYDAYRPLPCQRKLYTMMPDKRYVADPAKGSMHNRGLAADVTLAGPDGKALDMGCGFDDFSAKAAYHYPGLNVLQRRNRLLLRELMMRAGFTPYDGEWWHFNYNHKSYPLSNYLWPCR